MGYFGVIADDLTGAMDAGMQMAGKGWKVCVALSEKGFSAARMDSDFVVVNTQSRNDTPEQAYEKTRDTMRQFRNSGCHAVYKKIDSTLRGHIGAEIKAILDSGSGHVFVVPALPSLNRTTKHGIHYVNGRKLADTEFAKDPFSPISCSGVAEVIREEYDMPVGRIGLKTVRNGCLAISERCSDLISQGMRVLVADAEQETDLKNIIAGVKPSDRNMVLCGSAGLFQYFDEAYDIRPPVKSPVESAVKSRKFPASSHTSAPLLVISGSPAAISKKQIRFLEEQRKEVRVLHFDIRSLPCEDVPGQITHISDRILQEMESGRDVALDAAGEGKEVLGKEALANRQKSDRDRSILLRMISDITFSVVTQSSISGLILFGGDTAYAAAEGLGASGIEIKGQLEPCIPYGEWVGGVSPGLSVVTKAGGFGKENFLAELFKNFRKDENYDQ